MKKLIALLLAAVMCLSLCACGGNNREDESTIHTTETKVQEKKLVTVEITLDNWQEYFEIRPCEDFSYNDFGDLTRHSEDYALYLKDEHLAKLANASAQLPDGSVDVSFKVVAVYEFREYDEENLEFVEGGKVYGSPEEIERVIKASDCRRFENTDTSISTSYGQVLASLGYEGNANADCYYKTICTGDIDVIDVTGTLVFEE